MTLCCTYGKLCSSFPEQSTVSATSPGHMSAGNQDQAGRACQLTRAACQSWTARNMRLTAAGFGGQRIETPEMIPSVPSAPMNSCFTSYLQDCTPSMPHCSDSWHISEWPSHVAMIWKHNYRTLDQQQEAGRLEVLMIWHDTELLQGAVSNVQQSSEGYAAQHDSQPFHVCSHHLSAGSYRTLLIICPITLEGKTLCL